MVRLGQVRLGSLRSGMVKLGSVSLRYITLSQVRSRQVIYLMMYFFIYLSIRPSFHPFTYYQLAKRNVVQPNIMSRIFSSISVSDYRHKIRNCCRQMGHDLNSTPHLHKPHINTMNRMLQWSVSNDTLSEMLYKQLQHEHNCIKYARTICDTIQGHQKRWTGFETVIT